MMRIVQAVGVGFLAIVVGVAFGGMSAGAEAQYDWLDAETGPKVLEARNVGQRAGCETEKVPTKDTPSSPIVEQDLCIQKGKNIKTGLGQLHKDYILMPGDTVYKMTSSTYIEKFFAIEGTNGILAQIASPYTSGYTFEVYRDYTDVIAEQPDDHNFFTIAYGLVDNPDMIKFYGFSYGISNNGTFLVYTTGGNYGYRGKVYLINLETGDQQFIGYEGYNYTYSPLPTPSYAVSNDGKTVVEGGHSLKIWRIDDPNCRDSEEWREGYGYDRCRFEWYGWERYGVPDATKDYYFVDTMRFNNSASELSFLFHGYTDYNYFVTLEAPGYKAPEGQLEYLALGDSYTSGEGDTQDGGQFYLLGTEGRDQCHLSSRSYPYLLRDHYNIPAHKMASVACSGAQVVFDYIGVSDNYLGQNKDLEKLTDSDKSLSRAKALSELKPGIVKQLDFVRKYQPKTVTIAGGGNDVGFENILRYCAEPELGFIPFTCDYAKQGSSLNTMLYDSIDTQYGYMKMLINGVKEASPDSKIIMIGYPSFIAQSGLFVSGAQNLCSLDGGLLNNAEKTMINNALSYFNRMIQSLAYDVNVSYINIEGSLYGGRICEDENYVNGVNDVGTKAINNGDTAVFHPNNLGHRKIADSIIGSAVFIDNKIASQVTYSPNPNAIRTEPGQLVTNKHIHQGKQLEIKTKEGIFGKNTRVQTTLYSDPIDLGLVTTGVKGEMSLSVKTDDVPIGNHVLVLEGLDDFDRPIRYYQFISITEPPETETIDNSDDNSRPITASASSNELKLQTEERALFAQNSGQYTNAVHKEEDGAVAILERDKKANSSMPKASVSIQKKTSLVHLCILFIGLIILIGAIIYAKKHKKI